MIKWQWDVNNNKLKYLAKEILKFKLRCLAWSMSKLVNSKLILVWIYILIRSYQVYIYIMLTLTNDISQLSVWSGISSRACMISLPSSWRARPYWTKDQEDCCGMSFWMTETGFSRHVANVAVRVVQRDLLQAVCKLRTYSGSKLKLVTRLAILKRLT